MPKFDAETLPRSFLTREVEQRLLQEYKNGLEVEGRISKGKILLGDNEVISSGKHAEQQLLISHFPLVKAMAVSLHLKNNKCVELDDLLSAGKEGLVVALRKFNSNSPNRFSTYAGWWVRNRISLAIRSERWIIKIPDRTYKLLLKIMGFVRKFVREHEDIPSVAQIAEGLKTSSRAIFRCLTWMEHKEISLETPIGDDGKSTLGDLIGDTYSLSYQAIITTELKDKIQQLLHTLTPSEESVIKLRFGLALEEESTLGRIGDRYSLTAERIRQIECRALRKLRHPSRSRSLKPYVRRNNL